MNCITDRHITSSTSIKCIKIIIIYLLPLLLISCGGGKTDARSTSKGKLSEGVASQVHLVKSLIEHAPNQNSHVDSLSESNVSKPNTSEIIQPSQPEQKEKPTPAVTTGIINGHEWVDLGLPSGTKWATTNIGATSAEESGNFFAWGEVTPKTFFAEEESLTLNKDKDWLLSNGFIDKNCNLTLAHDAARHHWGGTWRMPTIGEFKELLKNTTSQWTTYNGVKGRLLVSKRNGNSIFLPASGWKDKFTLYYEGESGDYQSSSLDNCGEEYHAYLYFSPSEIYTFQGPRYSGIPIRPVTK